ncbi:DUF2269 family protein [Lysinibacillus sp. LZ02]|uniref:DUF2269 family protein n=1 Tax=Lysinibacillus sp. LZ02 TaxID=3420668 RepID=UPI003D366EAF
MVYNILLFIHILSAVVAIGPLFAIFPMLKRMEQADEVVLRGVVEGLRGAVRAVSLAGHVVIPSGLLLMWLGGWSWQTSWVLVTIFVMLASLLFLAKAFKPAWQIADAAVFRKDLFIKTMQTATVKYIAIMLIMLWLMVTKPQLW